jgi:adenine-specific DNA-methyltransferase
MRLPRKNGRAELFSFALVRGQLTLEGGALLAASDRRDVIWRLHMACKTILSLRESARRQAAKARDRMSFAREFVATVMALYRPEADRHPGVRLLNDNETARQIGLACRELGIEAAAYHIGTTYTVMLPSDFRSANGVFYTPPGLTARLLSLCERAGVDWVRARVLDPACGGGAFLTPVALRMVRALAGRPSVDILRHIEAHLVGFEVDPFSAWMSQAFLAAALSPLLAGAGRPLASLVSVRNSLSTPETEYGAFDLVIGNPPYGKAKLSKDDRLKWGRSLFGHANLYGLFADLGVRMAAPAGVMAYVTPTGFLGGQYFKALRELLAAEAPPFSIDFVASRDGVFADVLQEAMLFVCRKALPGIPPPPVTVSLVSADETGAVEVSTGGTHSLPDDPATPWLLPRTLEQIPLAGRLADLPHRLGDLGWKVSTGPLVWNRHRDQLLSKKRTHAVPLIWAEAVGVDGAFSHRTTGDRAPWYLPSSPTDSNVVRRPCVLVQRTTAPEQPRRLVVAEMNCEFLARSGGAVCVENHLNMVVPTMDTPRVSARTVAAFLGSRTVDQVYRCISGSVAVSAYEIESMPLPSPTALARLDAMLERGCAQAEVEAAIAKMYAPTTRRGEAVDVRANAAA